MHVEKVGFPSRTIIPAFVLCVRAWGILRTTAQCQDSLRSTTAVLQLCISYPITRAVRGVFIIVMTAVPFFSLFFTY